MKTNKVIQSMSNKNLLYTLNKINKEKQNPAVYGKHGTSRYVTETEFWAGHHKDLKDELKKRQNQGQIKKTAGKPTRKRSNGVFNIFDIGSSLANKGRQL